ncbi:MAG: right-handed parallel beta-helix repeat-containing protein, partial [Cyclobacteriaceae bacterium]|nr:right-handed parallel beta-helix repeat-containing protein [Cyclobacteriaceae bacterium]
NNSGYSPQKAWASLDKINSMEFKPGDQILFKAGTEYVGQLEPKGSGVADIPIIINKYGEGKKPAIHGKGKKLHTLLLHNVEYWEIRNLEITNTGKERVAKRRGVKILAEDFGDCHHILLDSLEIHHVNGSLVKKDGGGSAIVWQNRGDSIKTRFVDLVIQNCHLHHCGRNGINSWGNIRRDSWYPSTGVIIRNNLLEKIPGDGIVPIGCEGAIIEHNVMRDCPDILSHTEAAAGIWPWSSDNTIIQFNEVSDHRAKWDGQGFDSDFNCQRTVIQYNYSHDNYGGFLLVCNNGYTYGTNGNIGTDNTIIRYNVSINDGIRPYPTKRRGWFSPNMHISGPVKGTKIYNNLIFIPEKENEDIGRTIVEMDNWGGPWPEDTWFANNIFYVDG